MLSNSDCGLDVWLTVSFEQFDTTLFNKERIDVCFGFKILCILDLFFEFSLR